MHTIKNVEERVLVVYATLMGLQAWTVRCRKQSLARWTRYHYVVQETHSFLHAWFVHVVTIFSSLQY